MSTLNTDSGRAQMAIPVCKTDSDVRFSAKIV